MHTHGCAFRYSKWFKYLGVTLLATFSFFFREPVILLIWILVLPDLSFIPSKLKAVMAVLCAIGMTVLMGLGYSHQPWWVDLIDVVIAEFFLFIIVGAVIWGEDDSRQDE